MRNRQVLALAGMLVIGFGVGWILHSPPRHPPVEQSWHIPPGERIRVYQPSDALTHDYRLRPYLVRQGDKSEAIGKRPNSEDQLWVVECGNTVAWCERVKQETEAP